MTIHRIARYEHILCTKFCLQLHETAADDANTELHAHTIIPHSDALLPLQIIESPYSRLLLGK